MRSARSSEACEDRRQGQDRRHEITQGNASVADCYGSAVAIDGLTKHFGKRVAVDGLSLVVPIGVVAGFIGPNGAGKTTTMAMLLGLVAPTAGSGTVLGHSLEDPSAYLGRVGALVESPAFCPSSPDREPPCRRDPRRS